MALHNIEPVRETLHGSFSREDPPILTIDPGDTVRYRTLDAAWGLEAPHDDGSPHQTFSPRDPARDDGHALCGPIAIRGATPGMTLGVHIDAVQPGPYGWTVAGGWPSTFNTRLGVAELPGYSLQWQFDQTSGYWHDQHGHCVAGRPFMGVMGLPPDEPGRHNTAPPRHCGGNMDCKELVAGTTLYLPITVPGALFSVGDGHGAQGDGESSGVAIECPMELVALTFSLHDSPQISTPRAKTPSGWVTLGFHHGMEDAMFLALNAMLDLMIEQHGLDRREALALASLVVDLRVTQIVNGPYGVHAVLPHGAIQKHA